MLKSMKTGQSSLEFLMVIIIIIGSFLVMQNYFKRGIQGRWKKSVDSLGDQYDPRTANTNYRHYQDTTTQTTITSINAAGGKWTQRYDLTNSLDTKVGFISSGAY